MRFVARLPRNMIIFSHTHLAAQEVPGSTARVHDELARVDDLHAAIAVEVRPCHEELEAIGAVFDVVRALKIHVELRGERVVAETEGGRLAASGTEGRLGVLDEDANSVGDLLHINRTANPLGLSQKIWPALILIHNSFKFFIKNLACGAFFHKLFS